MKFLMLIFLVTVLLFWSCSTDTGGSVTETTNALLIKNTNGEPSDSAMILVVAKNGWYSDILEGESPIIDTLYTNIQGIVIIDTIYASSNLQISDSTGVTIIENDLDTGVNTIQLVEGVKISGTTLGNDNIYLSGTNYMTATIGDSFYLENVPPGTFSLYGTGSMELPLIARVNIDNKQKVIYEENDTATLLFQDFLGGLDVSPLQYIHRGIRWYISTDKEFLNYKSGEWEFKNSGVNGTSTITPKITTGAVRFDINLGDDVTNGAYAGFGTLLFGNDWESGYNLSEMTGIKLSLKGSGTLYISFDTEVIDSVNSAKGNSIGNYFFTVELSSSETDTTISVSDFHLPAGQENSEAQHPWSSCSENVKGINFMIREKENSAGSAYWFELEEIRFAGVESIL